MSTMKHRTRRRDQLQLQRDISKRGSGGGGRRGTAEKGTAGCPVAFSVAALCLVVLVLALLVADTASANANANASAGGANAVLPRGDADVDGTAALSLSPQGPLDAFASPSTDFHSLEKRQLVKLRTRTVTRYKTVKRFKTVLRYRTLTKFQTRTLSKSTTLTQTKTTTTTLAACAPASGVWNPSCTPFALNGRTCIDLIPCLAALPESSAIPLPPLTLDLSSSSLSLLSISLASSLAAPAQITVHSVTLRTGGSVVLYSDYDSYSRHTLSVPAGAMTNWGVNVTLSFDRFVGLSLANPVGNAAWVVETGGAAVEWQSVVVCSMQARRAGG